MTKQFGICSFVLAATFASFAVTSAAAQDDPSKHPDSLEQPGVPKGTVAEFEWRRSEVYPGTNRRYSIYVPDQLKRGGKAALMVFQDGHAYANNEKWSDFRAPTVFDNLIHKGEMPPTIGVFVDPGIFDKQLEDGKMPEKRGWNNPKPGNRANEYDVLSDAYANFLLTEILPDVQKQLDKVSKGKRLSNPLTTSNDPKMRAICGSSSGGICAFTVAWERPDQFAKVISHIGSFTNIRGGHVYPALVRAEETPRPIRVVLQDGSNDLNNQFGNWWLANQQMASSMEFRGWDVKTFWGEGGHNGKEAGRVFPDELKWLWRDWKDHAAGAGIRVD